MASVYEEIPGTIPSHAGLRAVIDKDIIDAQQRLTRQVQENPEAVEPATKAYLIDMFGIYARRHIQILRTAEQVRASFGPYLLSLIDPILLHAMKITAHWRAPLDQHRLVQELRTALTISIPMLTGEAYAFVGTLTNAEDAPAPDKVASTALKNKRRMLVRNYCTEKNLSMDGLARRVGMSKTAIYGMINGDRTRYEEAKLDRFLEKVGMTRNDWNTP